MNGVHDMGGMHGMGPVVHEQNEPVFHEPWERRVYAITRIVRAGGGRQNLDNSRYQLEQLPPADYLRMSYYERWFARLVKLLITNGAITRDELERGHPAPESTKGTPSITAAMVPEMVAKRNSARRDAAVSPRFKVGQRVRARNINPTTHTRLPRYARGKTGAIERIHGAHVFADAHARGAEDPQWLYTVVFDGRELWGDTAAPGLRVSIDAWEPYLEPPR